MAGERKPITPDDIPATPRGIGIDAWGGGAVDPTENVKSLSEASARRQDDLRDANNKYLDCRIKCMEHMAVLRAEHAKEIRLLEADRLEKIRQVDVLNASTAADRAGEAIRALALQTTAIAEAGRTTAANTAAQMAAQLTSLFAESNKRISALELSSSAGTGKSAGADWLWKAILAAAGMGLALWAVVKH